MHIACTLLRGGHRVFAVLLLAATPAAAESIDPESGLKIAPHWEQVRAHCGACHSYQLVTTQRGDRAYWLKTIRWMQRTQNLWPLPPTVEEPLLDYLSEHYNETEWGRRPGLPPTLLPSPDG